MSNPAHIILLSGQALFTEGLRALLAIEPDLEVVGEALDQATALRLLESTPHPVLLLDLDPPIDRGLHILNRALEAAPSCRCLVVAAEAAPSTVVGAFQAGAVGFLLKTATFEELANALRAVAGGDGYLQPIVSARVLGCIAHRRLVSSLEPAETLALLSTRELQILDLLARGYGLGDVPAQLAISLGTVRNHLTSIQKKLGARDRTEAVEIARLSGLGGATEDVEAQLSASA